VIQRKGGSDKEYKRWWRSIFKSGQVVESVENGRMEVKCLKKKVVEGVSLNY